MLPRYRRAANYLAAAQIYLKDNVLLDEPLRPTHIKDRLLGHWGTCPGINLVYAHLNRLVARARCEHPAHHRPRARRRRQSGQPLSRRDAERVLPGADA